MMNRRKEDGKARLENIMKLIQEGKIIEIQSMLANYEEIDEVLHYKRKASGDTPMIVAARLGQLEIIQLLHRQYNVDFNEMNNDGKRALHESAQFGHSLCVKYLLQNGADVNCLKRADWTPTMLACTKDSLDVIKILIDGGADVKMVNKDNWNCFHIACRGGSPDIVNYLLDIDDQLWNNVSNNGRTPLHTAALHGKYQTVKILLDRCSNNLVHATDRCGCTPLMDAIKGNEVTIARFFVSEYKANYRAIDTMGREPIHIAAHAGAIQSINFLLLELHIFVNTLTTCGKTALHCAAKDGQLDCVKTLISLGAHVNAQDFKGHTALHMAAAGGYVKVVSTLIHDFNAVDIPNHAGLTGQCMAKNEAVRKSFSCRVV